jgi:hypothetical protein
MDAGDRGHIADLQVLRAAARSGTRAEELGISRSEFFTRAARRYLDELSARSLTRQINDALRTSGADDSGQVAASAGRRRLAEEAGR